MNGSNPAPLTMRAHLRNPELTVAEVMRTDFRSCNASAPVTEVATAIRVSGRSILPVTRAQVPIGVVTEHGLSMALAEHDGDLSRMTAGDVMSKQTPTISMTSPIAEALDRLVDAGGYLLAVNPDGLLEGIVTLAEVRSQLSEPLLGRLVSQLFDGNHGPDLPPSGNLMTPSEEARAADPSTEIKSSKSQSQPHPWDSPSKAFPEPIPLVADSDLLNPMLTVADVMTPSPRTCSPASTTLEATLILRDAECGCIPVVDIDRPIGLLSDRDIAMAVGQHETDLASTPVEQLMTREIETVESDATLDVAIERFEKRRPRSLLAVDSDGRLAGVLSWTDLIPHLSERGLGHTVRRIVRSR
jgi:predicted transcriptional regulator